MQHESTHESRFHLEYANSVKKQRRWLMFPRELTHCRTSCSPFSRHHPRDPRFHDSGKQFSSFFRVFSFLRVSPPSFHTFEPAQNLESDLLHVGNDVRTRVLGPFIESPQARTVNRGFVLVEPLNRRPSGKLAQQFFTRLSPRNSIRFQIA